MNPVDGKIYAHFLLEEGKIKLDQYLSLLHMLDSSNRSDWELAIELIQNLKNDNRTKDC